MTFHNILFDDASVVRRELPHEAPVFFRDLKLDEVVNRVTDG